MALHFIIDGYNVIKSENTEIFAGLALQAQRERLIDLINRNRPQGSLNNKVTIVFDGTFENSFWGTKPYKELEVVFTSGETADKKIEEIVSGSPNPAVIVVVTDDKGIWRSVSSAGSKVMQVKIFLNRMLNKSMESSGEDETVEASGSIENITKEFKEKWLK